MSEEDLVQYVKNDNIKLRQENKKLEEKYNQLNMICSIQMERISTLNSQLKRENEFLQNKIKKQHKCIIL